MTKDLTLRVVSESASADGVDTAGLGWTSLDNSVCCHDDRDEFSELEIEVLRWIAEGKSDWEIGRLVGTRAKAVNYAVEKMKRRLGVVTRIQVVVHAFRKKLID